MSVDTDVTAIPFPKTLNSKTLKAFLKTVTDHFFSFQAEVTDPRIKASLKISAFLFLKDEEIHYGWDTNLDSKVSVKTGIYPEYFLSLEQPLFFHPHHVPKPWGQEIWYTGCEKRGVSHISCQGKETTAPLFFLWEPLKQIIFKNTPLVLVKILDPHPEEVIGDLYFEMHEEKNEVYIVTKTDSKKPSLRIGPHHEKLKNYPGGLEKFKKDFYESIKTYEQIRRKIDGILDEKKRADNIPINEPAPAHFVRKWLHNIPPQLLVEEAAKRKEMESFTHYERLKVGDVIAIPTQTPHALQHGVQVLEFQTPTYERLIVSFAQKVLTQKNWDTEAAFEKIRWETFVRKPLEIKEQTKGWTEECVCQFPDFSVLKVTLKLGSIFSLPKFTGYILLYTLQNDLILNSDRKIPKNQCVLFSNINQYHLHSIHEVTEFLIVQPATQKPEMEDFQIL